MKPILNKGLLTIRLNKPEAKKILDALGVTLVLSTLAPVDPKLTEHAKAASNAMHFLLEMTDSLPKQPEAATPNTTTETTETIVEQQSPGDPDADQELPY
jgi:hypothetical protein